MERQEELRSFLEQHQPFARDQSAKHQTEKKFLEYLIGEDSHIWSVKICSGRLRDTHSSKTGWTPLKGLQHQQVQGISSYPTHGKHWKHQQPILKKTCVRKTYSWVKFWWKSTLITKVFYYSSQYLWKPGKKSEQFFMAGQRNSLFLFSKWTKSNLTPLPPWTAYSPQSEEGSCENPPWSEHHSRHPLWSRESASNDPRPRLGINNWAGLNCCRLWHQPASPNWFWPRRGRWQTEREAESWRHSN